MKSQHLIFTVHAPNEFTSGVWMRDGVVMQTGPSLKWLIGQTEQQVRAEAATRGWSIEIWKKVEKITTFPPLPIGIDHWRSRWLHLDRSTDIHRIANIAWEDGEMIEGEGTTVCGRIGYMQMPGIFSRMGADRCPECCAALGIPFGAGAPYNSDFEENYQP